MAKIRNEELGQLAGEVLPERTVLGAVPAVYCAYFTPFCSPNHQTNSVAGSIIGVQGANNQCGLKNHAAAAGVA